MHVYEFSESHLNKTHQISMNARAFDAYENTQAKNCKKIEEK